MLPDFKTMSAEVAKSFLQTVVVVDDETALAPQSNSDVNKDVTMPTKPTSEDEEADLDGKEASKSLDTHNDAPHYLDAKEIIDAFAKQGLVCSIMQPEQKEGGEIQQDNENLIERVLRVSRRSDLLVLDWEIDKDSGDTTSEIIKRTVAEDDENGRGSLRLIAVYTGEPNLSDISERIANELGLDLSDGDTSVLRFGSVKIVVYAKEAVSALGPFENRRASFQDLPEKLINDFAEMTEGLVSNAAVKALSVLRDNSHSLLKRLHSNLDAPYLSHRLLLAQPEDASDFLLSLILSELHALLDENDIGGHGSGKEIKAWMASKHGSGAEFQIGDAKFSREKMSELLTTGSGQGLSDSQKKSHFRKITAKLHGNSTNDFARKLDMELAILTSMNDRYRGAKSAPMLTSGTILKELEGCNGFQYWLCIQPRCDSVRLGGEPRPYPLLPYEEVNSDSGKFDLVVKERDEFTRLKLVRKPYECQIVSFTPSSDDSHAVRASKQDEHFIFTSHISGDNESQRQFRWLGELKSEQAQRDAVAFAAQMSRPGLDEFEWSRRSAGK